MLNEDLGGGYSALFRLETGFRADTGALDESGTLFSRQANVGVAGPFGSLIAGTMLLPAASPKP